MQIEHLCLFYLVFFMLVTKHRVAGSNISEVVNACLVHLCTTIPVWGCGRICDIMQVSYHWTEHNAVDLEVVSHYLLTILGTHCQRSCTQYTLLRPTTQYTSLETYYPMHIARDLVATPVKL